MALKYAQLQDRDWLVERYVEQQKTAQAIARELGATKHAVYGALQRHGIERRTRSSRFPQLNDKDWLREQYVEKQFSTVQIAEMVGSTVGNVGAHLRSAGIELRSSAEGLRARFPAGRTGTGAGHWKGGRAKNQDGYVKVYAPNHPRATETNPYVFEHILVAEQTIGRHLKPGEIVHHKNHVKDDNRPENLQVTLRGAHVSSHFAEGKRAAAAELENAQLKLEIERLRGLLRAHDIPDGV